MFLPEMEIGIPSQRKSGSKSISATVFPTEYIIRQSVWSRAAADTAEETAIPKST